VGSCGSTQITGYSGTSGADGGNGGNGGLNGPGGNGSNPVQNGDCNDSGPGNKPAFGSGDGSLGGITSTCSSIYRGEKGSGVSATASPTPIGETTGSQWMSTFSGSSSNTRKFYIYVQNYNNVTLQ
jgi:hypothetical protein